MTAVVARGRQQLVRVLGGFSTGQKAVVALAVVGSAAALFLFSSWASKPSYTPLFTNLEASDASAITEKLASSNTPFQLSDGGRTVLVPRDRVYQTRLDMSAASLPAGGAAGYELLDKQGITTSEFRQRVDYQRALEGELSRTIQAIDGVSAATVHLVIPKDDLFADDASRPTASVLVKTRPGKAIGAGQAQAIVHLVSSSVEAMAPEDVTVADSTGHILSASGDGSSQAAADARTSATQAYEEHLAASVQDMLARVLGPGNAAVQVRAELDLDQARRTTESFDTSTGDKPINEATTNEQYQADGAALPGGVLGLDSTQETAGGSGTSSYTKGTTTKNYAVGKTVEELTAAPGAVKRLSVAVLLNSKAKGADPAKVQSLVEAATGMSKDRGDTIAVDTMPFDASVAKDAAKGLEAAESAEKMKSMASMVRSVVSVLLVLVVLFLLIRASRRTERVAVALPAGFGPTALPAGEMAALTSGDHGEPVLVAAPAAPARVIPELRAAENQQRERVQHEIGELIERQPDEVAQLLRSWLADRRG